MAKHDYIRLVSPTGNMDARSCSECSALVIEVNQVNHDEWHEQLNKTLNDDLEQWRKARVNGLLLQLKAQISEATETEVFEAGESNIKLGSGQAIYVNGLETGRDIALTEIERVRLSLKEK